MKTKTPLNYLNAPEDGIWNAIASEEDGQPTPLRSRNHATGIVDLLENQQNQIKIACLMAFIGLTVIVYFAFSSGSAPNSLVYVNPDSQMNENKSIA